MKGEQVQVVRMQSGRQAALAPRVRFGVKFAANVEGDDDQTTPMPDSGIVRRPALAPRRLLLRRLSKPPRTALYPFIACKSSTHCQVMVDIP